MNKIQNRSAINIDKKCVAFRHWFRLVFTLFSLYLMRDIFYRWDGFKFNSSFFEYLPNVALALIIWSVVALLVSILVWLPLKVFERVFVFGLKTKTKQMFLSSFIFILMAAFAWIGRKYIWFDIETVFNLKLLFLVFIACAAIPLIWLLQSKTTSWNKVIQEHITPLVWLFAICLMISLPIAGFQMWKGGTGKKVSQDFTKSTLSESARKRPNILLVTFDALSANNMSVYGYSRKTTPFIDKWANTASLFTRTKAGSNHTASATPCIITGKRVWTHRKYQHDLAARPVKSDTENLALVMKENGYYTSAFIANIVTSVDVLGISRSMDTAPSVREFMNPASIEGIIEKYLSLLFADKFSTYNWIGQDDFIFTNQFLRRLPSKISVTEFPPELAFNRFLEVMDNNAHKEPFFAWIHVFPPHDTYLPPEPFAGTFNPSNELRENNAIINITPETNYYLSNHLPFSKELNRKIKLLRDYYDEFILYSDNQFGHFINELQKRNWSENTVIIVSSDHGESFEHDYYQHGKTHLYEAVTHIPLIIKEPEQAEGLIIDDLVEQIDIPATILELADIPVPQWMEGRSLVPLLRDRELPPKPAISAYLYFNDPTKPITQGSVAVWEGDYKLIHYLYNEKKSLSTITHPLLFNLNKDPGETHDLFNEEPVIGQRLLKLVNDNLKQANERIIAEN